LGRVTNLAYDDRGTGDPVLFIAGRGGAGRTWHLHQVPAFQRAGYRIITFDNRGVGATENDGDITTATMVNDTATLIEELVGGPVRIVGVSMGSFIAQELMVARSELVSEAVLMATRGRHDHTRAFFTDAEKKRLEADIELPPDYSAKIRMLESFSPSTLNNDRVAADWIEMFTMWPERNTPGLLAQLNVAPHQDRLPVYRSIANRALVIGFADDVVTPPHLGAEVADAMPNAKFRKIREAGHLGFIEQPEAVNTAILEFFGAGQTRRPLNLV
jgi:pimeloyl-ACP methyl ester carboxylesterase